MRLVDVARLADWRSASVAYVRSPRARLRDVGPDLQAVRVAAEVRGSGVGSMETAGLSAARTFSSSSYPLGTEA